MIDFENRERLFPAVDSRMKFCLLTVGQEVDQTNFAFFLTDPRQLVESERRFTLSADEIERINPNTKTAPVFRSRADAEIAAKIYARVPVFVDDNKGAPGDPWYFRYMTKMFDMADSSSRFRTASQLARAGFERSGLDWCHISNPGRRYVPLYEAKMISFFNHRAASYAERGDARGYRVLPETTEEQYSSPTYEVAPFYWVLVSDFCERRSGSAQRWRSEIFRHDICKRTGRTLPIVLDPDADPRNADWLRISAACRLAKRSLPTWAALWLWRLRTDTSPRFWDAIGRVPEQLGYPKNPS